MDIMRSLFVNLNVYVTMMNINYVIKARYKICLVKWQQKNGMSTQVGTSSNARG